MDGKMFSEELIEKVFGSKTFVINNPVDGSPLLFTGKTEN